MAPVQPPRRPVSVEPQAPGTVEHPFNLMGRRAVRSPAWGSRRNPFHDP